LDRLILFGERRVQHALVEFVAHYHGDAYSLFFHALAGAFQAFIAPA